jgi:hypothetical protein
MNALLQEKRKAHTYRRQANVLLVKSGFFTFLLGKRQFAFPLEGYLTSKGRAIALNIF